MIIINTNLWGNIETGLNVDSKFIQLQYNMAIEKALCNLMLHTEQLHQRGKESVANSTWNSISELLAKTHFRVGDTQEQQNTWEMFQMRLQSWEHIVLLRTHERNHILSVLI